MNKIYILLFLFSIIFVSCEKEKPEIIVKKDSVEMIVKKDTTLILYKEFDTRSGKKFVLIESKPSMKVSNYMITGISFNNSNDTLQFKLKNPLDTAFTADLDKNGFEELYIVTRSTGAESFLNIFGVASVGDSAFKIINLNHTSPDSNEVKELEDYLGNDTVYISNGKLIREYPIYKSSDLASDNTKGNRKIIYSLKQGDEFYELQISEIKDSE